MARTEPEPFQVLCPLCTHDLQVDQSGDMCQFCGAQIDVFHDYTEANQFAETCKEREETAGLRQVVDNGYWVVGHKASPHQEMYRRAG